MNPGSRGGRGKRSWAAWESRLRKAGCAVECCVTRDMEHARELAREGAGCSDAVVAVGGDGTINAVLDGVMRSGAGVPMGVLYAGTSPDFCRFHGIPDDARRAAAALTSGSIRAVDVGRISFRDGAGRTQQAFFACSVSIGLGAAVARMANRWRPLWGDRLGTGLAVLRALAAARPMDLRCKADGEEVPIPRANHLAILKNPFIASGLRLSVGLRPDDGDVCLAALHGLTRRGLLAALPGFYSGRAAASRSMRIRRCRRVSVTGPEGTEVEFDGDPRGYLPVEVEVVPRALRLMGVT